MPSEKRSILHNIGAGIAQSVEWLAMGWTVRGSNPNTSGGEIFHTCPDRPWGPPSILNNGYRVYPGVKRPRHSADHPPLSNAKVKERVGLYLHSPSAPVTIQHQNLFQLPYDIHISWNNTPVQKIRCDSKRWTQFRKSIFPELYMVCEWSTGHLKEEVLNLQIPLLQRTAMQQCQLRAK
jgi:hypothetical protein